VIAVVAVQERQVLAAATYPDAHVSGRSVAEIVHVVAFESVLVVVTPKTLVPVIQEIHAALYKAYPEAHAVTTTVVPFEVVQVEA
jgi:hypothetical protein